MADLWAAWVGLLASLSLSLLVTTRSENVEVEMYDVLVYSANAAGVGAAVTAAANGRYKVKVVEPLEMIGGMAAAGGVALMNQGGCGLTGLSKNWSMICGEYYMGYPTMMTPVHAPFPSMNVSEMAFWQLLRSRSTIDVSVGCRVISVSRPTAYNGSTGCLGQVDFICANETTPMSIHASYIIDASYDGDVMVMAGGIDYTSGREAMSTYNESLAGVSDQDWTLESFDRQGLKVNPYFSNGTLLKYIDSEPLGPIGSGDDKVMAYQYFACVSNTPGNMVPFWKPEGYNPDDFMLLLRQIQGLVANGKYPEGPPLGYFGGIQCYSEDVQKKTGNRDCLLCCGTGPVDADQPDLNHGWPSANFTRRQEIAQAHRYYLQGSLYFMANDPRVPNNTRTSTSGYGYCKDEYAKYGNFPPQLYVRISNRLQGESLLTQNNIVNPRIKNDSVARGCWEFDQHTVSRHVVVNKSSGAKLVANEGFFRAALGSQGLLCDHPDADCSEGGNSYDVPYGAITPKRGQASNLLVPVIISATSVAYASTRIENMFMDLGSAAGVAVAQLLDRGSVEATGSCPAIPVQDANVSDIQHVLLHEYGQVYSGSAVSPPAPTPPAPASYTVVGAGSTQWNGLYKRTTKILDDRPVYSSTINLSFSLYSYASQWRLGIEGREIFYVASGVTPGIDVPLTGWQPANGSAPAPHLEM